MTLVDEVKEQLDRIEGKIDELLNRLGESPLEKRRRDRTLNEQSSEASEESEISLEELNERLDRL